MMDDEAKLEAIERAIGRIRGQIDVESVYKERGKRWLVTAVRSMRDYEAEVKSLRRVIRKNKEKEKERVIHERYIESIDSGKRFKDLFTRATKAEVGEDIYNKLIAEVLMIIEQEKGMIGKCNTKKIRIQAAKNNKFNK
tara:strand:+ start:54 stop:470 length:417 start_codon:yes stop_codon:yes gene_type:complete